MSVVAFDKQVILGTKSVAGGSPPELNEFFLPISKRLLMKRYIVCDLLTEELIPLLSNLPNSWSVW